MLTFIKKALGIVSPSEDFHKRFGEMSDEDHEEFKRICRTPLTSQSDPERREELLERYKEE